MPSHVLFTVPVALGSMRPDHLLHAVAPAFLTYHWYFRPLPSAFTVKVGFAPMRVETLCGWAVILMAEAMVTVAVLDVTVLPYLSLTTQRTCMPSHVLFTVPAAVAEVRPDHLLHVVAPAFLKYH